MRGKVLAAGAASLPRVAYPIAERGMLTMWERGTAFVAALLCAAPLSAQVVRLEIASREPMNAGEPAGAAGPFELIRFFF